MSAPEDPPVVDADAAAEGHDHLPPPPAAEDPPEVDADAAAEGHDHLPPPPAAVTERVGFAGPLRWFLRAFTVYWPILIVAVLAIGVRLWMQNDWMPECTPEELATVRLTLDDCYAIGGDAGYYNSMAYNVAHGDGYTILSFKTFELEPGADHPPGYITFLAVLDVFGQDSLTAHRTALAVLGGITTGLMGLLGWRLGGRYPRATGVVAALFALVYAGYWMSDVLYMSESFFVPFIVLTLLCAFRFWRDPGWRNAVFLGAAAGGAWLTRGEAALVLGFIVVGFVLFLRAVPFWRRFAMGVVACAVCIGLMLPWIVYNLNRFPEPIFVAATGPALALNSCDEVWYPPEVWAPAPPPGVPQYSDATGFYSFGCLAHYTDQTVMEDGVYTDAGIRRRAMAYITDHLDRLPAVMAIRVSRVFGVYQIYDTRVRNVAAEGRRDDWVRVQQFQYYAFVLLAVAGLVAIRRRRLPMSPIIAPVLAVAASVAGTFAIYRYRLAADTAIIAAAAVGVTAVVGKVVRSFQAIAIQQVDPWIEAEAHEGGDGDPPEPGAGAAPPPPRDQPPATVH